MIALSMFKELTQKHGGRLPLLTLDEFFNGNTEEDSICERLCSDGVIAINGSELTVFSRIPAIPEGFRCLEIVWD